MRFVPISAITINTSAPTRSIQGARLKNSHHSAITNPHNTPTSKPMAAVRGKRKGTTNHASHCSTTAITPGHNRSRFGGVGNAVCSGVIVVSRVSQPHESTRKQCYLCCLWLILSWFASHVELSLVLRRAIQDARPYRRKRK